MLMPPTPGKLSPELLRALHEISPAQHFPKGARLFQHGSEATGVYLVEEGEVRVMLPTGQKRSRLLEVVGPGNLLGLKESMGGERYRVTAVSADETTAVFISREQLLNLLRERGDFCMQIVTLLGEDLHGLYDKFRTISAHPGRPRQRPPDEQLN